MRMALGTTVLVVSVLALPAPARAWGLPDLKVSGTCRIQLRVQVGNTNVELAPWYLYYPAEAAAQPYGAAGHFPNWPAQPTATAFGYPPAPGFARPGNTPLQRTGGLQPVVYHPTGAPGYWYGD